MNAPYEIIEVDNVITEESATIGDYASSEATEPRAADLREALSALDSDCWDNVDVRGDGTIIAYPADYRQSMTTGDWEATEIIIRPRLPHWGIRLYDLWSARNRT